MSTTQTPNTIAHAEDDYDEEEDTDFNPDAAAADDAAKSSESDEEDTAETTGVRRQCSKTATTIAEDVDFDNSGDEATIQRGKKRKRKGGGQTLDDDEGGEGGLIKTRAQRMVEQKERKKLATAEGANVDVNALWAQMAAPAKSEVGSQEVKEQAQNATSDSAPADVAASNPPHDIEAMITIKRTYDFAGQTMTEEKSVPVSSAEAKLYVAEQARKDQEAAASRAASTTAQTPGLRRPKKRASIFGNKDAAAAQEGKAPKLTTLEKSKLDWAAHVDEEGIVEELEEHKKAKGGYLGRMDFLGRMDEKRGGELKGKKS